MDNSIAIIVEGAAEEAIINVLLNNDKLIFTRNELIDDGPIRMRKSENFEKHILDFGFPDTFDIYRVLDSKNEKFKISSAFKFKVGKIVELYTTPEIEMLFIVFNNDYDRSREKIKPSVFCKQNYHDVGNIKSREDVYNFWNQQPDELVAVIREYARLSSNKRENTLERLLK